jgi:hypothetical protein
MSLQITFGKKFSNEKNLDFKELSELLRISILPFKKKILLTFSNHEKIAQWISIVNNMIFPLEKKIPIGKLSDSGMKKRNLFTLPEPIYDLIENYCRRKIQWKDNEWHCVDDNVLIFCLFLLCMKNLLESCIGVDTIILEPFSKEDEIKMEYVVSFMLYPVMRHPIPIMSC